MKKRFSFLCPLALAGFSATAQITITETDLPQAGNTYLVYTDTTPSIALGTPSATAQSWNFTSLSPDYPSVPTYGYTSWTPYASAYPASNIYTYGPAALYSSLAGGAPVGSQGMSKGYMFWRTDYSGFHIIGFRADSGSYSQVNVQDNPSELLIGTPATYGTAFNNTGAWTFPMNINPADYDTFYTSRTVKTLTSDAWGDLTTPSGYYPAVLRIHEHYVKTDSVYVRFNNILVYSMEVLRDTANNYIYMANGLHYPVSIVHADAADSVSSVEYYSGVFTSVAQESPRTMSAEVYPNPLTDRCIIGLPGNFAGNGTVQLVVSDLAGRVVRNENHAANSFIEFEAGELPAGIYTYVIINNGGEKISGKLNIIN